MMINTVGALDKLGERSVITDGDLVVIQKSSDDLFDSIDVSKLLLADGSEVKLPVTEEILCEYRYDKGLSCALKIVPLKEGGYHIDVFHKSDAAMLAKATGLFRDIKYDIGGIKRDLATLRLYFDISHMNGGFRLPEDEENAFLRDSLIRPMSNIVNFDEVMRYVGSSTVKECDCFVSIDADDICALAESRRTSENVVIIKDIDLNCHINAEPQRFRIVLANLIVNAFIYNDSKEKRCTVKVERLKDGVCIKVKDNGRGFDAQRFGGVIFDRHRESLSGEGLGLLIAKCFCERYGGVLDIDSDESGTCVTMTFYDDDREPSRNFAQIPDYDEEEINCVQYVLSKFFRGVRPDMSLLVPEPEEEEN